MIANIIFNELRNNILSLRLHLALLLTTILFGFGAVSFVMNQKASHEEYRKYQTKTIEESRNKAETNLSWYATSDQTSLLPRRETSFLDDARERYLPNRFRFNAYNVFGFDVSPGSANPLLKLAQELSWMYIVAIIIGFTVLLFTFDAISGEKEARTLAATLANPVSRATLLFGKYLSAIFTALLLLFPGLCLGLIIFSVTGSIPLNLPMMGEILGFLLAVTVFVALMAAFGLLSSVLVRSANVSLLIAIAFWLVFVVIIPNTALFWGESLFPIEPARSVAEKIQKDREDINKHAPEGSWSSSSNPFLPEHELRAANQTKLMLSEKRIRDAWYGQMIRQIERTRMITYFSPVSLFQYMSESVVGGGYVRFRKNWDDLHTFQGRFLSFFKDKDAADTNSPHWYNPYEDYSTTKKKVNFQEVPRYVERTIPLAERVSRSGVFFLVMSLYTAVVFSLTFVLFMKYDVR